MTDVQEISRLELHEIGGGDWFETTWGVVLGAGFGAGLTASGGLLLLGMLFGAGLVFYPF